MKIRVQWLIRLANAQSAFAFLIGNTPLGSPFGKIPFSMLYFKILNEVSLPQGSIFVSRAGFKKIYFMSTINWVIS